MSRILSIDEYAEANPAAASEAAKRAPAEPAPAQPFTCWPPSQFLAWEEPPGSHYLLPKYLSREQITSIIGPPGVGKSRLLLWLAICQILRRLWCGLETGGEPQLWCMLGDENSIGRLQHDLKRMLAVLDPDERESVERFLRIQAVITPDDGDLDLQDDAISMRVIATLEALKPGVVTFDPLTSFYGGDLSKPGDMKQAVRLIQSTVNKGCRGAATVLSHHARVGRANTIQAVGFDAGNFASGGKALLARSRCVINLVEADEKGTGNVLVACAKANDCRKFEPRAVLFDPETSTYTVDGDFSLDRWKAVVDGKVASAEGLCTLKDVVEAIRDGYTRTGQLVDHLGTTLDAKKRTVHRHIKAAMKSDYAKQVTRGNYILGPKANLILEAK
jgi:hypothetical protein